jgi:hypothetical protein
MKKPMLAAVEGWVKVKLLMQAGIPTTYIKRFFPWLESRTIAKISIPQIPPPAKWTHKALPNK